MDAQGIYFLRTEPGSIGDTARAYATGFKQLAPVIILYERMFNHAFNSVLLRMERESDDNTIADGNLLIPIHTKGIIEIHRLLDLTEGEKSVAYKLDLPTMILYAMLLESSSFREGFIKMENEDIMTVLRIIHEEITSVCQHQVIGSEYEFVFLNSCLIPEFIMQADYYKYFFP